MELIKLDWCDEGEGREGGKGRKGKEPSSFVKRLMNISSQRKASSSQNTVIIILMLCEVIPFFNIVS